MFKIILIKFIKFIKKDKKLKTLFIFLKNLVKEKTILYTQKKKIKYLLNNDKIILGFYKNIYYNNHRQKQNIPRILGVYENYVTNQIININKKYKKKYFINIGASDGYHAIGLVKKKIFEKSITYEMDSLQRHFQYLNISLNNLKKKISVREKFEINEFLYNNINISILKDCFFLIDVEGEEFNFFNTKNIKFFNHSCFVIELHNWNSKRDNIEKFYTLFSKNFNIRFIDLKLHDPYLINKKLTKYNLEVNHLNSLIFENRSHFQQWLLACPKKD